MRRPTMEYDQVPYASPSLGGGGPGVIDVEGETVDESPPEVSSGPARRGPTPSGKAPGPDAAATATAARGVREHRRRHPSPTQAGFLVSQVCDAATGAQGLAHTMAELVLLQEAGLEELTARFPGPLWADPRVPDRPLPRAAELGPIPATLVAFGQKAYPVVAALMRSNDPEDRLCAAAIAADFPSDDVLHALCNLLLHSDASARRMALRVLPALARLPGYAEELAQLRKSATIPDTPVVWRVRAIEALAHLGDRSLVPVLVPMLRDPEPEVAEAAHEALCVLTAHDWGRSRRLWRRWLERHGQEPRETWLLEGLTARRVRLREHALSGLSLLLGRPLSVGPACARADCKVLAARLRAELEA